MNRSGVSGPPTKDPSSDALARGRAAGVLDRRVGRHAEGQGGDMTSARLHGESPRQARQRRAAARLQDGCDWRVDTHAEARRVELGFGLDEVLKAASQPEMTYPNGPGHPAGWRIAQRGDLTVVLDPGAWTVRTVLLGWREPWTHGVHTRRDRQPVSP
jgi:hypothetical protein